MLKFESLKIEQYDGYMRMTPMVRSKIPGGWIVVMTGGQERSIAFVPDPNHTWDGSSLD